MYSVFRLSAELDSNRKITDLKSKYLVKLLAPTDLAVSFNDYADKFYKAAHAIASFLLETGQSNTAQLDTYFFSLAFLYRHSIELKLKAIAFKKITSEVNRVDFAKDTFHDLAKILEKLISLEAPLRSQSEINWLRTYFSDISKLDKESDSFRYPFHIYRKNDPLYGPEFSLERVFEEQTHIDLCKFANKFEAAHEILDLWFSENQKPAEDWKELRPIFIETGGTYYGQAVVGYGYRKQDFYPYVNAYVETAGYLRACMKKAFDQQDKSLSEYYFLPMCYLYRNASELVLKAVWFEEVREDFQSRCKILNKKKHSIKGMWNQVRKWINVFYGGEDGAESYFVDIEACCNHLQSFDNDASIFRYPCRKDMQVYFRQNISFDFMNVAEFMESMIHAIDGIDSELGVRNEYYNEMEAIMRSELEAEYRSAMAGERW